MYCWLLIRYKMSFMADLISTSLFCRRFSISNLSVNIKLNAYKYTEKTILRNEILKNLDTDLKIILLKIKIIVLKSVEAWWAMPQKVILTISLSILHYFDSSTKFFSNSYRAKVLDTSAKQFKIFRISQRTYKLTAILHSTIIYSNIWM